MFSVQKEENHTIIRIENRLDTLTSQQFDRDIKPLAESESFIIADFTACPYLSSSGIRSLLTITKFLSAKKGRLILFGLSAGLIQVLEMAGLQKVFHLTTTQEEALEAISQFRQSTLNRREFKIEEINYEVHLTGHPSNKALEWHNQGLVGYNELGISFGIGQDDEDHHPELFATVLYGSAFFPEDDSLPGDFKLTRHPSQSGIFVHEALSFGQQPGALILSSAREPLLVEQILHHIGELAQCYFPSSQAISFVMVNQDPHTPSLLTGLFNQDQDKIQKTASPAMANYSAFNSSEQQTFCIEYQLEQIPSVTTDTDLLKLLKEVMTFDNIQDVRRMNRYDFVSRPAMWLFAADRIEKASSNRIKVEGPEDFYTTPAKPFLTRRLYADSSKLVLKALHGGFSAQTFQVESYDQQGRKLRPTVLKLGHKDMITREALRCQRYALPFILNNSAMVLGTEFYGDLGALRYNFVGIGGEETRLKWLTHLFNEWTIDQLGPLFDKIFLQILKPWYGQAIKETIFPFKEHDPTLTFFPNICNKALEILHISADEPEFFLKETGKNMLNPYWYLKHHYPRLRETGISYYTSICHGDLNMQNILLDQDMNVYLIDFSETIPRSAVSDFARLEAIFMVESMPVETEQELTTAITLLTEFYQTDTLSEQPFVDEQWITSPVINRNIFLTKKMRSYARASVGEEANLLPYYFALLEWVLPIVCFAAPLNQKRLSMALASILLERIAEKY